MIANAAGADDLAVYVHWPFCASKCPYCDFNSHVRPTIDPQPWSAAYASVIRRYGDEIGRRRVHSIFFGGGTPSLMPPALVGEVIDAVARAFDLSTDAEITLEANPSSVEAAAFGTLRRLGVNRVSLGIQALDDATLAFLGRAHDVATARHAAAAAANTFDRYSLDFIYGRPGHTPSAWRTELAAAIAMAGDHISAYQLTIEPGTAFATRHARGDLTLPDEDTQAALYEITQELLAIAGLPAYEVSNHARPGAACRHNLAYWTYGDYLGVGPGAHGRVRLSDRRVATRAHRLPETWLQAASCGENGERHREDVPADIAAAEAVMMGLRLADGIDRQLYAQRIGRDPIDDLNPDGVASLCAQGFLRVDADRIATTPAGLQRLNAVTARLLA